MGTKWRRLTLRRLTLRRLTLRRLTLTCATLAVIPVAIFAVVAVGDDPAEADRPRSLTFEVTVTNLTRGQVFSPAVVATHTAAMRLFTGGEPASDALAAVAEDAVLDPLLEMLEGSPNVRDVVVLTGENGPILPGESASVTVRGSPRAARISLVGMLVTTNDAFYGLNAERGPFYGAVTRMVPAYDAGSEANNELCSHIPGPPCGNAGVRDTDGAEGYVHVHAGVHGVGDLDPSAHDWRNPVASVTIRRVSRKRSDD